MSIIFRCKFPAQIYLLVLEKFNEIIESKCPNHRRNSNEDHLFCKIGEHTLSERSIRGLHCHPVTAT